MGEVHVDLASTLLKSPGLFSPKKLLLGPELQFALLKYFYRDDSERQHFLLQPQYETLGQWSHPDRNPNECYERMIAETQICHQYHHQHFNMLISCG